MNKLYVPALALALVGASAHAQNPGVAKKTKHYDGYAVTERSPVSPVALGGAQRDVFWTEDFSGGSIPAGWTNVDAQTPVGQVPAVFAWSSDPTAVSVASLGHAHMAQFNATGAGDGYVWVNSDRGLASAPAVNHITRLTTGAIDCSGQTSVMFTMQSVIGVFDNDASEFVKLRVSTDLTNWTDFAPFPCLVTGSPNPPCERFSANPQAVAVDITAAAANQPVIYLQLEWTGGWEYYWAVDDMALSPLPDYEIQMNYAYTSTTGTGEEYGRIPASQLPGTMNVGAELFNLGLGVQTNTSVTVAFADNDGNAVPGFSTTLDLGDVASGETVVADGNINIPTGLPNGIYRASFAIESDNINEDFDDSNNAGARHFEITDDVYSIDAIGNHPDGTESLAQYGTATFTDNAEIVYMSMYVVNTPMTATGVIVDLSTGATGTVPGANARIEAFLIDTVNIIQLPASPTAINGILSNLHTITQADVDAGSIGLAFESPITLQPGAYFAAVKLYGSGTVGGTDPEVYILDDTTVPQPAWTSAIYLPIDIQEDGTEGRHSYTNGNAFAIRLTSNPNVSVAEMKELTGINVFPNPTNGVFQISSDRTDVLFVEITDITGKVVRNTTLSSMATVDMSDVASGVYTVTVSNATERSVHKVTVK